MNNQNVITSPSSSPALAINHVAGQLPQPMNARQKVNLFEVARKGTRERGMNWRAFRGFDYVNGVCVQASVVVVFANGNASQLEGGNWQTLESHQTNAALHELGQMRSYREANNQEYKLLERDFGSRFEVLA